MTSQVDPYGVPHHPPPQLPHEAFYSHFGHAPEHSAWAPGRVNLAGEHTDYNGGWVLPTPLRLGTRILVRKRKDGRVRAHSTALAPPACGTRSYDAAAPQAQNGWIDYLQGLSVELQRSTGTICGADVWIHSDLPLGSGLSSSAALEVSFLRAMRALYALDLDDVQIAQLGQACENKFVGAACGIMDQMAVSVGQMDQALFLCSRTLAYHHIPLPPGLEIAVINSGESHTHATGGYNQRRQECSDAARLLGVANLCALPLSRLAEAKSLPHPLPARVRHVVGDHHRVQAVVTALQAADMKTVGTLCYATHVSLRDDFEVSIGPIDALVEAARHTPGVFGARLVGGGFGGCVMLLGAAGAAQAAAATIISACKASCPKASRIAL